MLANVSGLILFFVAFWTYRDESATSATVTLSVLGVLALGVGGWFGGEMVYEKGLAVDRVETLEKQRAASVERERPDIRRAS